jgi:type IV secretory pathway VirB6-like protein
MSQRLNISVFFLVSVTSMAVMSNAYAITNLTCAGNVASGQLFDTSAAGFCEFQNTGQSANASHMFSQIICNFVSLLNAVLDNVYCGMQATLKPAVAALLTLYIAIFGLQILMGTVQFAPREIIVRLLKIVFCWLFVSQSTYGINFVFNFFTGLLNETSMWVLNGYHEANGVAGAIWTVDESTPDTMQLYNYLDTLGYDLILSPFVQANSSLIGLFMGIMVTAPPIFAMAAYWLFSTIALLARTLVTFIAFLVSLSPLFLSFMLFQLTFSFFESWLRHLISFSLQVVVLFGVVVMWMMIMSYFIGFFNQLSSISFEYHDTLVEGPVWFPRGKWGICPFQTNYNVFPPTIACSTTGFDPMTYVDDADAIISAEAFVTYPGLFAYISYMLIALLVIADSFNKLIKDAPHIARTLVGPEQATGLFAPGWTGISMSKSSYGDITKQYNPQDSTRAQWVDKTVSGGASNNYAAQSAEMAARRRQLQSK